MARCPATQLAFLERDATGKLESVATITAAVEQVDDAPMFVISGAFPFASVDGSAAKALPGSSTWFLEHGGSDAVFLRR
jgi:hypothetical protein